MGSDLTKGASFVTEWNSKNGSVRTWNECYNKCNNVNRIHPKNINGQIVKSNHYPPTFLKL